LIVLLVAGVVFAISAARAEQPPNVCFSPNPPNQAYLYEGDNLSLWREARSPASLRDRACLIAANCTWAFPELGAGLFSMLTKCNTSRAAGHETGATTLIHYCSAEREFSERLWLIASVSREFPQGVSCRQTTSLSLRDGSTVYVVPAEVSQACILIFLRASDMAQGVLVVPARCDVVSPSRYPTDSLYSGRTYWIGAAVPDGSIGFALSLHNDRSRLMVDEMNPLAWDSGLDLGQITSWLIAVARASNSANPLPPENPLSVTNSGGPLSRGLSLGYVGIIRLSSVPFSPDWYSPSAVGARRWLTKATLLGFDGLQLRPELLRTRAAP
jgi:hypothetical protein